MVRIFFLNRKYTGQVFYNINALAYNKISCRTSVFVETKESGKVEAATTEDVSLPQTGHKHSNAGLIGLGLATIASLLGLAGTRKRKKD